MKTLRRSSNSREKLKGKSVHDIGNVFVAQGKKKKRKKKKSLFSLFFFQTLMTKEFVVLINNLHLKKN